MPQPAEYIPGPLPERLWWERVDRAAKRRGGAGSRIMSDWSHDMLRVQCPDAGGSGYEFVCGRSEPVTPERFTAEYIDRETRRLKDELGRTLGVGPMPS